MKTKSRAIMKHMTFKRTRIAASVSLLLGAGMTSATYAQEAEPAADDVEVIQVKALART